MHNLTWVCLSFLIFGCSNSQQSKFAIQAADPTTPVVYGEDNRSDYFEVQDETLKALAQSTVAIVSTEKLVYDSVFNQYHFNDDSIALRLCENEKYRHQPKIANCSGSLIAPDIILTAGHCFDQAKDCELSKFVFDYHLESPKDIINSFKGENVYSCAEVIYSINKKFDTDFALIRLDRPVLDRPALKLSEKEVTHQDKLLLIGHPSGLPTKFAFNGKVRNLLNDHYIVSSIDSFTGNSGSAVFNQNTGEIIGVLVRGDQDWSRQNSCYIAKVCKEDDCRGEDITRITEIKKFLPR